MIGEEVIAKAVGAILRGSGRGFEDSVLTFDKFKKEEAKNRDFRAHKVDLDAFHQLTCVDGILGVLEGVDPDAPEGGAKNMQVNVKTLDGETFKVQCSSTTTIGQMRIGIQEMEAKAMEGVERSQSRLHFAGRRLEDDKTLGDYNIQNESTVQLVFMLTGGGSVPHYVPKELLSPGFDFDFTGVVDTKDYTRGSFTYKRPCGWNRIALNVLDKYENNVWIGAHRKRTTSTSSVDEEWPVSYHGTGKHDSRNIASSGYRLSKGKRFHHGRGIYSTPDIDVAELYAQKFTHGTKEFLAVVQNRVNPKTLIRIPPSSTGVAGEYWVTPDQEDIRPYGICIKQLN